MTHSLRKHEGPNSIPGSYIKMPHMLVCTWNPNTRRGEVNEGPGAHWPVSLAYLASPSPVETSLGL